MTTKIKTTLLTAFFFFGLLTGLQAQDKFDFALAYLDYSKTQINVVQNDMPVKVIETGKKATDYNGLQERFLSTISQLTTDGWEVYNTTSNGTTFFYFLRKKKN
jgi:hypothetical protein